MKIIVHRGTHQIGGCCTEISTDHTRILIDYGTSLPGGDSAHLKILLDEKSDTQKATAVLISHYHGDHVGEIGFVPEHIPVYMGTVAKQLLMLYKQHQPHSYQYLNPDSIVEFGEDSFTIGDISVTPIPSDHSAFDSYMFLIEGDGKRVLHTGDYRLHGPRREKLMERLAACCKNVDIILCICPFRNRLNFRKGFSGIFSSFIKFCDGLNVIQAPVHISLKSFLVMLTFPLAGSQMRN